MAALLCVCPEETAELGPSQPHGILGLMSLGTAWGRTAGLGLGKEERGGKRKDNIHAHIAQGIPKP